MSSPKLLPEIIANKILLLAFDLGSKKWKLCFTNGSKNRVHNIDAGNLRQLDEAIERAKVKFKMKGEISIYSCYEAGRDGFWLHRHLTKKGVTNYVVDPSGIEVSRKKRRAKTDGIDAKSLARPLHRYVGGEEKTWIVLRVPTPEQEDDRHLHREIKRLKKEKTALSNSVSSLLIAQGIIVKANARFFKSDFDSFMETTRTGDGLPLGRELGNKLALALERERWLLTHNQLAGLTKRQARFLKENPESENAEKTIRLEKFRGAGFGSAWVLVFEYFGWRDFRNVKEVGAAAGLNPTPHESGDMSRELGISKSGNSQVRGLMVELAWRWLYYQPRSRLSLWFAERFSKGSRQRRIGIVALARKLLVAFWKYLKNGTIPENAIVRPG